VSIQIGNANVRRIKVFQNILVFKKVFKIFVVSLKIVRFEYFQDLKSLEFNEKHFRNYDDF